MNKDLLQSMKESVGEMDSKLGYSSQKLAMYFDKTFQPDYNRLSGLHPSELTAEDVLSRVSEILASYDSLKSHARETLQTKFNSKELKYIYQFFGREYGPLIGENGPFIGEDAFEFLGMELIFEMDNEREEDFCFDKEEIVQFCKKLAEVGPYAFYFLQILIWEELNHLPSENDSKITLYDYLLEPVDYSENFEIFGYPTDEQIAEHVKSHYKGEFNKSQLRYLNNFYYGNEISKISQSWFIYLDFIKYIYDPTNEDLAIGAIESKKFLWFVESVKKMGVSDFAGLLKLLAEICEQSQALNDDFKLFEEFLDDFASAEE